MSNGTAAEQVEFCREMLGKGAGTGTILKGLRDRFGLALVQAKKILVRAECGLSLEEYQERFAEVLEQIERDNRSA